jgi:hypothetical protein
LSRRQGAELSLDVPQTLLLPLRNVVELTETLIDDLTLVLWQLLKPALLLLRLLPLLWRHLLPAGSTATQTLLSLGGEVFPLILNLIEQAALLRS